VSINFKVVGEGFPIVILHGWSLDHQTMLNSLEPVFENRNGWKRIYIDLPGMGGSRALESIQNADDMLKEILKFVDEIIPNEPFLVCGYSYGGYLSQGIVHSRKNLVCGMLLLAPVIIADHNKRSLPHHQTLKEDPALISSLSSEEIAEFEPMAIVQGEKEWERFRKEILIPSKNANSEYMERIQQNGYSFTFEIDKDFLPFEYPTLIITGRQDSIVGYKDAWQFIDYYPRATIATLDMAGHNLQIEQSNVFEALTGNWLERVEYELSKMGLSV
jgi:pimeloyl-ACP methyl ester carboxylesterase